MTRITRRAAVSTIAMSAAAVASAANRPFGASSADRKFTMDLTPGMIGVNASPTDIVQLAADHGFESVQPNPGHLASLDAAALAEFKALMKSRNLVWGAAGLPVEFRQDEARFKNDLKNLPKLAKGLQAAGVTRIGTWLMPRHNDLTYLQNMRQHATRLRACVKVLNDHGLRFGMEYVGPKTLWAGARHSFIHTMAETKDLIGEIGEPNVGLVLDSWHWYTAHETADDLRTLTNKDIIACDLNDAPTGIEIDEQIDNRRELPAATGVIDLKAFLSVLRDIGYDGPVRAEPFNAPLNKMENEAACAATAAAIGKAFAL